MKRGVWFKGVVLLVLVTMAVGLGACSRSAAEREGSATTPAATSVGSGAATQVATPSPGETVVSAVSPVPQTTEADAQPTAQGTTVDEPTEEATEEPADEPTATPTSPSTSGGQQDGYVVHVVQRGETLYSIARKYGTTYSAVVQANSIRNPSMIYVGQRIKVPTSGGSSGSTSGCRYRHTVQRGEWLWQIAREYGVSPYTIMSANGMSLPSASTIYAGMVLCIP
jgi:LysM repeat protein